MDKIDKYEVVGVIGEGGMGRVYEAVDPMMGRHVAIKMISLGMAGQSDVRARFVREAQAAGQLSHPNLITIHDIGVAGSDPYIVMEYLEGADLGRTLSKERLSLDAKMRIMTEICRGLAFAHSKGIVHRDIKPANIFITTDGRVKILDFGLARSTVSEITRTGGVLGTPNYMAPEQIKGEPIDARADLFSAGVVFYEMLSGRKAFEGDSVPTTIYKVLETSPPSVHEIDAGLPSALSAIVARAIAKHPQDRFQTAPELLEALARVSGSTDLATTLISAAPTVAVRPNVPVSAETPAAPARSQLVWRWAAAGAVVVVVLAGIVAIAVRNRATPPVATDTASPQASSSPEPATRPAAPGGTPVDAPDSVPPASASGPRQPAATAPSANASAGQAAASRGGSRSAGSITADHPPPATAPPSAAPTTLPPTGLPSTAPAIATAPPSTPALPGPPSSGAPESRAPLPGRASATSPAAPAETPAEAAASAEAAATTAVQAIVARYTAALESRDIDALKRIWPALSGRQEEAIRSEFAYARAIDVGLEGVSVKISGASAVVTGRRNYRVTTVDGRTLRTATRMTMTLARHDGGWNIETIRHETTP